MFPKLGSIPPAFLKPFNYSNVENALDMWGAVHKYVSLLNYFYCSLIQGITVHNSPFCWHSSDCSLFVLFWNALHFRCYHWTAIDGFAYWTDINTDEDVQFKDGNTGVFWNFGKFTDLPNIPDIFKLPSDNCNVPCNNLGLAAPGAKEHLASLDRLFNKMSHQQTLQFNAKHN